jgi:hypothetical protein
MADNQWEMPHRPPALLLLDIAHGIDDQHVDKVMDKSDSIACRLRVQRLSPSLPNSLLHWHTFRALPTERQMPTDCLSALGASTSNPSVLINWIDFPLDLEYSITLGGVSTDIGEKIMDKTSTHIVIV